MLRMYERLLVVLSRERNIYFNLSLENYLLSTFSTGRLWNNVSNSAYSRVLYFWRNSPAVIIGRNQNLYSECNLNNITQDVNIVRRFTGGGAVYQDLGNLCFTIISDSKTHDFNTNSQLICSALTKLIGVRCDPTGRNDMCVNGLKFSGSAFKVLPNAALHHGTLLININKGSLEKYLTPEKSKLAKHNVKSVESRVTNLAQFKPDITHQEVCDSIISETVTHFQYTHSELWEVDQTSEVCNEQEFKECYNKLTDRDWIYGTNLRNEMNGMNGMNGMNVRSLRNRFEFGSVEFCLDIRDNQVENVFIYSDMLNADFIQHLIKKFNKSPFPNTFQAFEEILNSVEYPNCEEYVRQIKAWLRESL
ncbi:lipoyltransferase and lipoate-protein ligase family protein [Theileria parva strain Muguga]|uniref:lipoate--protein ligase n=1 Tax=Theileria parva TaxID=5875 RepID=Q4N6H8_THEPA|nr:lipoyltransferase and lipoate-protein ligase family protein [Theileria parva strain Muguga]EAN34430.1 lipoyltransferase and lipoate-protein ligase family protein [Theileria parva strain Muguga]|eukprot:XP_766713.1 lipoate-protein ligase A [Theileria parva strain Muguga]